MYKDLTTSIDVELDAAVAPPIVGKPISKVYSTTFSNEQVSVTGKFEGEIDRDWNTKYTREELPSEEAKGLYDAVIKAVNDLHLAIRKSDKNFKTDKWVEFVEEND